jgi:hypothetical protein
MDWTNTLVLCACPCSCSVLLPWSADEMGVQRQREMEQLGTGTRMGVSRHASSSANFILFVDEGKQKSISESELFEQSISPPFFLPVQTLPLTGEAWVTKMIDRS